VPATAAVAALHTGKNRLGDLVDLFVGIVDDDMETLI
jgi:hypothetical protein